MEFNIILEQDILYDLNDLYKSDQSDLGNQAKAHLSALAERAPHVKVVQL